MHAHCCFFTTFAGAMRIRSLLILLMFLQVQMFAQSSSYSSEEGYEEDFSGKRKKEDSSNKKKRIPSEVRAWQLTNSYLMQTDSVIVDTLITNYQDNNPMDKYSFFNSYNGSMASVLLPKIYFDRKSVHTDYLFSQGYDAYVISPEKLSFYNTKTPYAHLAYRTGGESYHEEDYLRALFTLNANKRLNFGGFADFIYARGTYSNQSGKALNLGFWGSYLGRNYVAYGAFLFNRFDNAENGGITDSRFISNPQSMSVVGVNPSDIPVNLQNAFSRYRNDIYFYSHKYRIGKDVEYQITEDSVGYNFVPMMSFLHTIKVEHARRRYLEKETTNASFYENNYISNEFTNDTSAYVSMKNLLGITLEEAFNKKMRFGLTAYVQHELQKHEYYVDTLRNRIYDNNLKVGGSIFKNEGSIFKYNVTGDVTIVGDRIGDFNIDGKFGTVFNITDSLPMSISAFAWLNNAKPTYFLRDYISNHYYWRNEFKSSFRVRAGGEISIPYKYVDFSTRVQFENITNLIYFDSLAMPVQNTGKNVQVLSVDAGLGFHAWKLHLENRIVYQMTSDKKALPLPDIALMSNFYFKAVAFKVLTIQLGAKLLYHTSYCAPSYMPATGQFYNQTSTLIGNYPYLNAYINFYLKKVRFYVQVYNLLSGLADQKENFTYFSMPNYPTDPLSFRFGLSWSFYD